ncbi:ATP-binding protein [Candidatus Methanarcanum hacksteinii]|mgnify:FL=1|uniref:ATP-binding protein n=1 Tax=Candidatus Methanarcanum hacksteinii TaxID=2911857 RepID=UPI0037DD3F3D
MTGDVLRTGYLDELLRFKDQDVIKVVTGMRRCGKSTLLRQFIELLKNNGTPDSNILYYNMESVRNDRYRDGTTLYNEIVAKQDLGRLYIILDEVQYIEKWERIVNSLRIDIDCDIYITGSNAYLLSTEISTLLTGRNIEIRVLPLSFREFSSIQYDTDDRYELFLRYVHLGGMPFIRPEYDEDAIFQRLDEIKSDIILKDICSRKERIDSVKVRKVIDYMFSEIGNAISAGNIAENLKISSSTSSDYLSLVTDSLLFDRVERYDLRGRTILKTDGKYYCADIGMRNTQPLKADRDSGKILENIVYLELRRRGYKVYVGAIRQLEIDFIALKHDERSYIQVCQTISDEKTRERELRPFRQLLGNGRRLLVTGDPMPRTETEEAMIVNIIDFLME